MVKIENSNFLLTGGSAGIGKATAKKLIKNGGKVAITGRDESKLKSVAEEIGVLPIHADVANQEDVEKTYKIFFNEFDKLDCLINNAGIGGTRAEVTGLDWDNFINVYSVNVFGAAMMAKKASQTFIKQNYGNIVNIASTAATKGYPYGTVYASSKFALRGMTECWRAELRKHNVRVILINPSEVVTAFGDPDRVERKEVSKKLRSEEIAHTIVTTLEMDNRGFIPEVTIWATNPF